MSIFDQKSYWSWLPQVWANFFLDHSYTHLKETLKMKFHLITVYCIVDCTLKFVWRSVGLVDSASMPSPFFTVMLMMSGPAHSGLNIDSGSVFEQEFHSVLKSGIRIWKYSRDLAHGIQQPISKLQIRKFTNFLTLIIDYLSISTKQNIKILFENF